MALAFLLNMFLWGLAFIRVRPSDVPFTLHYNIYTGVHDLIGEYFNLYKIPLTGTILFFLNSVIGYFFYFREKSISYLFQGFSVLLEVILAVALLALIWINY